MFLAGSNSELSSTSARSGIRRLRPLSKGATTLTLNPERERGVPPPRRALLSSRASSHAVGSTLPFTHVHDAVSHACDETSDLSSIASHPSSGALELAGG